MSTFTRKAFDMFPQGHLFGIGRHTQPNLTRLAANRADHRGKVIAECAASASLVGPSSWRVQSIKVLNPFFSAF